MTRRTSRWVFAAYGAADGESDKVISALKLVTILMKGDKLGVEVGALTESSEEKLAEALVTILVNVLEYWLPWARLAQFKQVHNMLLPNFNKKVHKDAEVIEGEKVMILRSEQGTQHLLLNTSKTPRENGGRR